MDYSLEAWLKFSNTGKETKKIKRFQYIENVINKLINNNQ